LHLVLKGLKIGKGDEVITTPFTMAATIEAILYTGARPVLIDIDPVTLNINSALIEKYISRKTKAIIAVDIAGWPCDYDNLRRIAQKCKLHLVEDAAHSLGAYYQGKPIGSIAEATVFSFYSTKNITTGEGGMVVTNSKSLADEVRLLALHGMTSSGWKRYSGGGWKYDINNLGFKYNMPDLAAGLGLGQLSRFDNLQKKRTSLAQRYLRHLEPLEDYLELPYRDTRSRHSWHLFIIKLDLCRWRISRDKLINELEKNGVGCSVHFIPIYRFSYFKKILKIQPRQFPFCESAFKRVISLPLFPDLSFREVDYVCDTLRTLTEKYRK
ncbi:MAG: DegT/DnrJ/EryC1/StrS family aminotransferase, partial [candidate division Zixibacteria bacterium]|nr:DegT/DnrJ/EryC1/StrS family aminotransferase [candidate division Zixibacteria bacterium]